jgi:hypothetical protein
VQSGLVFVVIVKILIHKGLTMRRSIIIAQLLLIFFSSSIVFGQKNTMIHDLRVFKDSLNQPVIFFRIFEEYDNGFYKNNIYRYDFFSDDKSLFLEEYYDNRHGYDLQVTIPEYNFFDGDLNKEIYIHQECINECERYLNRFDSLRIVGGPFIWVINLLITGSEKDVIYAKVSAQNLKSPDGGLTWPTPEQFYNAGIPDSFKISIPALELNPYSNNTLFGHFFRSRGNDNSFYRSIDGGGTSELVSDTLYPLGEMSFDVDSITVYMLDVINAPREENPVTPNTCPTESCAFGLYKSNSLGKSGTWELVDVFSTTVKIKSSDVNSGEIYAWNDKTISISTDYGNNFSNLYSSDELTITGFDQINGELFFSTNTHIYKLEGNEPVSVYSIPTSSEAPEIDFPSKISLAQNYPNPFNPSTTIRFELPTDNHVELVVFDMLGRKVAELVNEFRTQGTHTTSFDATNLSSGIYLYQFKANDQIIANQMTLIK